MERTVDKIAITLNVHLINEVIKDSDLKFCFASILKF